MPVLLHLLGLLSFLGGHAFAADATAILKVRSNVAGADVYVDDEKLGATPLTRYLPAGPHQVRVVADRHDPFVRRVELAADTTFEVQATLVSGAGTVEFVGPAGARVMLDDVERGVLPIRLPSPAAGTHRWKVAQSGFEPAEGTLEVVAGRNYLLPVKLESSAGVLAVISRPAGARVKVDGVEVGTTPLRMKGTTPERHAVEVALDGHARVLRSLDTTGLAGRAEIDVALTPGGASLEIHTGRADAKVYGNDVLLGEGADVRVSSIERGRLKVRVEGTGLAATGVVNVPADGTLALRVAGTSVTERRAGLGAWPLWAGVGGAVVLGGATTLVVLAGDDPGPAPAPEGASVVRLP